jgi:hypothetical protein
MFAYNIILTAYLDHNAALQKLMLELGQYAVNVKCASSAIYCKYFVCHQFTVFCSQNFTLPPAYLSHKDERALPGNFGAVKVSGFL